MVLIWGSNAQGLKKILELKLGQWPLKRCQKRVVKGIHWEGSSEPLKEEQILVPELNLESLQGTAVNFEISQLVIARFTAANMKSYTLQSEKEDYRG